MTPREMRRALKLTRNGLRATYPGAFITLFTAVILWRSGGLLIPITVSLGVIGLALTATGLALLAGSYITRALAAARETRPATKTDNYETSDDQTPEAPDEVLELAVL